ncbi:MAG TPA: PIN domain-containing protein [Stellaceae bacterium]
MILADSSVWINHLRAADERLTALLNIREILGHPFVVGEVALGHLTRRAAFLRDLRDLPQSAVATDDEVMDLIERERLFRRGIGYVDAHLLAAVRLSPDTKLWTADRSLQRIAVELGLSATLSH